MLQEQTSGNSIGLGQSRTCQATFQSPTKPGSLIVVIVSYYGAGSGAVTVGSPSGFTQAANPTLSGLGAAVFYYENAPSMTSITVTSADDKSMQVRCIEYSGMRQSGALDVVVASNSQSPNPYTGTTAITSQADSVVLGVVANQYASTTQYGFNSVLNKLYDLLSPQGWGLFGSNYDYQRHRCTIHHTFTATTGRYSLAALLSSIRFWVSLIIVFRGNSGGPIKLTSKNQAPLCNTDGRASTLTVFGALRSGILTTAPDLTSTDGDGAVARIGPFNYQYRLGGWTGLLIGDDTPYTVVDHDGLEGWQMRTSDDDLPRGDGALRGVDLEAARQIVFELKIGTDSGPVRMRQADIEVALDALYRTLVPQRDGDWELIWRHPNKPLRLVRVRPTDLVRQLDPDKTQIAEQKFALVAADPRHYGASVRKAVVPVTPAGALVATPKTLINIGSGYAYPTITINGPSNATTVTRIELTNTTLDVSFAVATALPMGSTLTGDMEARATGANRSVVTVDGQSKYGGWQHPRTSFLLGPGANDLTLQTVPAGAPVTCTLTYRDTWSG